jgi:hypothetical protein
MYLWRGTAPRGGRVPLRAETIRVVRQRLAVVDAERQVGAMRPSRLVGQGRVAVAPGKPARQSPHRPKHVLHSYRAGLT